MFVVCRLVIVSCRSPAASVAPYTICSDSLAASSTQALGSRDGIILTIQVNILAVVTILITVIEAILIVVRMRCRTASAILLATVCRVADEALAEGLQLLLGYLTASNDNNFICL